MDDPATLASLAAQVAAEALIVLGWPVEPSEDFEAWILGCLIWSDADLMAFAARRGVQVPPTGLQ